MLILTREQTSVSGFTIFARLTRIQFLPLILLPAFVGTALAYHIDHTFNPVFFVLVLLGIGLLHLGANAIDDCYDYQNGVDTTANSMFPKDFGGWKPLPRGFITLRNAKIVSYALFFGSLLLATFFAIVIGPWSLILGLAGVVLAIIYTAPPFKLDYRGFGLGEASILFAFGPIPVLGAYYVQTGDLSISALLVSIPIGILTVTVLMNHDMIFYEVYRASKKMSLAAILGRSRALKTSLAMTVFSYAFILLLIGVGIVPLWCVIAPIVSVIILARRAKIYGQPNGPPPSYIPLATNGIVADWIFTLLLGLTCLI